MHVTKVADIASIVTLRQQHIDGIGFGYGFLGGDWLAVFIAGTEVTAVQHKVIGVFAGQHGIRLRACGDQYCFRRDQRLSDIPPFTVLAFGLHRNLESAGVAVLIGFDRQRRQAFGEGDAFLQSLVYFLVVERV